MKHRIAKRTCRYRTVAVLAVLAAVAGAGCDARPRGAVTADGPKPVAGWVEYVRVFPGGVRMKAKLDTGARTSSVHAPDCRVRTKGGGKWARFTLGTGKKATLVESPVVAMSRIKTHAGQSQRRPVVILRVRLGDTEQEVRVNLVDRSAFNYPVLLGRSFIREAGLAVDPARTFTVKTP